MLAEEQIIQKISSAGPTGLRKTELKKVFPQPDTDMLLEKLSKDGKVMIEKKGTAHYCWLKDTYMQYVLNVDPKFRLTYEAIFSLEQTILKNGDRLLLTIDEINSRSRGLASENATQEHCTGAPKSTTGDSDSAMISLESFKIDFDAALLKFSSSIGWVDFSKIRNELCKIYELDNDSFYSLTAQLMTKYPEKYELSSGGYEGLTVRGLLHGFVRCI